MTHPGELVWAELSADQQALIEEGWSARRREAQVIFNGMSAENRWQVVCSLKGRNGHARADAEQRAANVDPDTVAAFDNLAPNEESSLDNPVPLPGDGEPLPFPVAVLPGAVKAMVCAVADSLSVPVDLAALAALGVISTAIAGAVEIQLKSDWKEPANLYLVGIARSGEGKSPMLTKLEAPLLEIERDRQEPFRTVQADAETQRAILEKRRSKAINEGKDDDAYKAARDLGGLPALALPRLVAHDATPEALVKLLSENGGRLGVISDEGGDVFELSFRYGNSARANLGIYLHGWDGRRYVEDRAGRDPRTIDRTTLTMALMVQQVVVTDLLADARATGRGLAARYLWSYPTSKVGMRPVDTPSIPFDTSQEWSDLVACWRKWLTGRPRRPLSA